MDGEEDVVGAGAPDASRLMRAAVPVESLEERVALRALESRLFGVQARPIRFGRYVLLRRLGEGAYGIVYEAFDPTLDRSVAIKLLTANADGDGEGGSRLLGEAQSLARLSHPHVVGVFDAGVYGPADVGGDEGPLEIPPRGVFVVMELLRGGDFWTWTHGEPPPSQRDLLRVLAEAGRGLVAAHAEGLVHRDFKPENVIVGADARARVVDFGLAAAQARPLVSGGRKGEGSHLQDVDSPDWSPPPSSDPGGASSSRGGPGSPAYMSPEQHAGLPATAQSDQYAFAVTAYEALFGRRPFEARSLSALVAKKREGRLLFPARPGVSRRVLAGLERALDPDPAKRFPELQTLVEILSPSSRRTRWVVAAGVVGLLAGGVLAQGWSANHSQGCSDQAAQFETLWRSPLRTRLAQRLRETGVAYAESTAASVDGAMERWRVEWYEGHERYCDAAKTRPEAAETAQLGRCLDRRMREMSAVLQMLHEADATIAANAFDALDGLEPPSTCLARRRGPDSLSPEASEAVELAYAELAAVQANRRAGDFAGAQLGLDAVEEAGLRTGSLALQGAVKFEAAALAEAHGDMSAAETALMETLWLARRADDEELEVDAWTHLVWIVGVEQRRPEEGERWAEFAEAALAGLGEDPRREAELDHNRGGLAYVQQNYEAARAHYERALARQREVYGAEHPRVATTLNHLGNVTTEGGGDLDRAERYVLDSLRIRQATQGETHPSVAYSLNNLAGLELRRAHYDLALQHAIRAAELAGPQGHAAYPFALRLQFEALRHLGREDDAAMLREELIQMKEQVGGWTPGSGAPPALGPYDEAPPVEPIDARVREEEGGNGG